MVRAHQTVRDCGFRGENHCSGTLGITAKLLKNIHSAPRKEQSVSPVKLHRFHLFEEVLVCGGVLSAGTSVFHVPGASESGREHQIPGTKATEGGRC